LVFLDFFVPIGTFQGLTAEKIKRIIFCLLFAGRLATHEVSSANTNCVLEAAKQQHCRIVVSEDLFEWAGATSTRAGIDEESYASLSAPIRGRTRFARDKGAEGEAVSYSRAAVGEPAINKGSMMEDRSMSIILEPRRRDLVAAPLITMAAMARGVRAAHSAGVDPAMTIVKRPDEMLFKPLYNFPPGTGETATLAGDIHAPGQYFIIVRWLPGWMSAPHWYESDRLSLVLSGTWWVASGEDFAPEATVPVTAGSFVRRVAKTPHYDGVKKGAEPALIAISGIGPINYNLTDPTKPGWREV
jgi:hypothetical protein